MEAQLSDIAADLSRFLLDPVPLGAAAIAWLTFVTGAAGRVLELIDNRRLGRGSRS